MRGFLCLIVLFWAISAYGQDERGAVLLTGASFATSVNGWFELGCEKIGLQPLNRAIGGEAIADAATRMEAGELYTVEELDDLAAFVIMQVHNRVVFDSTVLATDYRSYVLDRKSFV